MPPLPLCHRNFRACSVPLCRVLQLVTLLLTLTPTVARADKLRITSKPPGATVELDGIVVGTTPFERDFPGGYFHPTKTAIGKRLEYPMVVRVSLAGYTTKEMTVSQGPMTWIGLNGRHHGECWLLKADRFDVDLDALDDVFTGSITRVSRHASTKVEDELPLEDLIAKAKSAVVYLRGVDKSGTGFFITQTGVIATNAHVARNEEALALVMSGGIQLDAKVAYVDDELDIALVKVAGNGFSYLPLADTSTVRQGESVFAIGNPGDGMQFSVTQGIVSNVGPFPSAGRGTWIQTDAQMNPGNSGGPLTKCARGSHRHQHAESHQEKCERNQLCAQRGRSVGGPAEVLPRRADQAYPRQRNRMGAIRLASEPSSCRDLLARLSV